MKSLGIVILGMRKETKIKVRRFVLVANVIIKRKIVQNNENGEIITYRDNACNHQSVHKRALDELTKIVKIKDIG